MHFNHSPPSRLVLKMISASGGGACVSRGQDSDSWGGKEPSLPFSVDSVVLWDIFII